MPHAVQYINNDPIYMAKKHYCPDCKCELQKVKVSKVVNSSSDEAKDIPKLFSKTVVGSRGVKFRRYNYIGDVKYVYKEFECEKCGRHFTVDEMKKIEGVDDVPPEELSPEEQRKIKIDRFIFNKVLPVAVLILIAVIYHFIKK